MNYLRRFPVILSITMTICISVSDIINGYSPKEMSFRMGVVLIIFFFIGRIVRTIILKTFKELNKKKEERLQMKKLNHETVVNNTMNDKGNNIDIKLEQDNKDIDFDENKRKEDGFQDFEEYLNK